MVLATSTDGLSTSPTPFNMSGPAENPGAEGWHTLPDSLPAFFTSGIQLEVIVAILIAPLILKLAAWIPHGRGRDLEQSAAGEPRPDIDPRTLSGANPSQPCDLTSPAIPFIPHHWFGRDRRLSTVC